MQYRPLNYDSGKEDAQKAQIQSYTVVLKVGRDVTVVRINRHFLKSPDEERPININLKIDKSLK